MQHTRQGPFTHWEYKIVRARRGEFADRRHLAALLRQESRAGWILVEKYDDSQVRFKRLQNARSQDELLPPTVDPYRTVYSPAQNNPTFQFVFLAAFLVEKYDDSQVRFKRLQDARSRDELLPPTVDPYRTVYSPAQNNPTFQFVFLAAFLVFVLALIVLLSVLATWPR